MHELDAASEAGPGGTALCIAIIALVHKLGVKVVAEGVETERQRSLLSAAGCDYAQGYLFAQALPAAQLSALVKAGAGP